jgi:hypothetical protein
MDCESDNDAKGSRFFLTETVPLTPVKNNSRFLKPLIYRAAQHLSNRSPRHNKVTPFFLLHHPTHPTTAIVFPFILIIDYNIIIILLLLLDRAREITGDGSERRNNPTCMKTKAPEAPSEENNQHRKNNDKVAKYTADISDTMESSSRLLPEIVEKTPPPSGAPPINNNKKKWIPSGRHNAMWELNLNYKSQKLITQPPRNEPKFSHRTWSLYISPNHKKRSDHPIGKHSAWGMLNLHCQRSYDRITLPPPRSEHQNKIKIRSFNIIKNKYCLLTEYFKTTLKNCFLPLIKGRKKYFNSPCNFHIIAWWAKDSSTALKIIYCDIVPRVKSATLMATHNTRKGLNLNYKCHKLITPPPRIDPNVSLRTWSFNIIPNKKNTSYNPNGKQSAMGVLNLNCKRSYDRIARPPPPRGQAECF